MAARARSSGAPNSRVPTSDVGTIDRSSDQAATMSQDQVAALLERFLSKGFEHARHALYSRQDVARMAEFLLLLNGGVRKLPIGPLMPGWDTSMVDVASLRFDVDSFPAFAQLPETLRVFSTVGNINVVLRAWRFYRVIDRFVRQDEQVTDRLIQLSGGAPVMQALLFATGVRDPQEMRFYNQNIGVPAARAWDKACSLETGV